MANDPKYQPLLAGEGVPRKLKLPERGFYKYLVLASISLICFGSYFAYDEVENFPVDMQNSIGMSQFQFNLLYSLYSFPNFVLPFFGGMLGDKLGLRRASIMYSVCVVVGAVIVALGPALALGPKVISGTTAVGIMLAGRVIFGAGAESLNVLQNAMVSLWFKGRGLAFALSATLSVARLGDFLTLAIGTNIANAFGSWVAVMWVGAILCGVSLVANLVYCALDKAAENVLADREPGESHGSLNFKAVLHFDARFWIVAVLCLAYYSGVFPFIAICSEMMQSQFHIDAASAGWYSSTITLASMVLSPFMGRMLDAVGGRPYFIILGSCLIIPMHVYLALVPYEQMYLPIIPVIVIGLSFSLVPSALWPCVPLITKDHEMGTAFGLLDAIQQLGLFVMNLIEGLILPQGPTDPDATMKYRHGMWFFAAMDVIGLLMGVLLIIVDRRRGGILTRKPSAEKMPIAEPEGSVNS